MQDAVPAVDVDVDGVLAVKGEPGGGQHQVAVPGCRVPSSVSGRASAYVRGYAVVVIRAAFHARPTHRLRDLLVDIATGTPDLLVPWSPGRQTRSRWRPTPVEKR